MLQLEMDNKRKDIVNNVRNFFDNFSNMDAKVFSDLRQITQESEMNFIGHMENLKGNVSKYFNEGPPEKDRHLIRKNFEEENLRKKNAIRIMRIPREQLEQMDAATGGYYSLQFEKMHKMNLLRKELENIK
jgi:hypothetical protein